MTKTKYMLCLKYLFIIVSIILQSLIFIAMNNLIKLGLLNKVFAPEDVAELVFGKLITTYDNVDWQAKTGTKIVTWKMHNCEVFSEDLRRKLLWEVRGDWHNFNYDFVLPRILCAIGYECVAKEFAADVNHTVICWETHFKVTVPDIPNAKTLPLREILHWHEWEMPYTFDEVPLIQREVNRILSMRQEWYEAQPARWREDIEKGVNLPWPDVTSGLLHYVNRMIEFLIDVEYTVALPRPVE